MKFFIVLLFFSPLSLASELIYTPVSPSFGGSPLNGSFLINSAQAQNNHKDPDTPVFDRPSSLDRLTSSLQYRLLNQLIGDVGDGNDGSIVTDDFVINIVDENGSLSIVVEDINTSEITEIQVEGLVLGL